MDGKILQLLAENPRNISAIARKLNLPIESVRYRVKKLLDENLVRVFAVPNHPKLGLIVHRVFLESKLNRTLEGMIDKCPYVSYLTRCYGHVNGYFLSILAPRDKSECIFSYLEQLVNRNYAKRYVAVPNLPLSYLLPDFSYYDFKERTWKCQWDRFLKCILNDGWCAPTALPQQVALDHNDILIIQELQIDATVSLTELANKLGLSVTCIRYHFLTHIVERGLVRFAVTYLPYPGLPISVFMLSLRERRFANSFIKCLRGLPPALGASPSPDGSSLTLLLQAPAEVKLGFYEALKHLMDLDIISSYFEVVLDPRYVRRYTIPGPEYYHAGRWVARGAYTLPEATDVERETRPPRPRVETRTTITNPLQHEPPRRSEA